jgi:hypothetical protein
MYTSGTTGEKHAAFSWQLACSCETDMATPGAAVGAGVCRVVTAPAPHSRCADLSYAPPPFSAGDPKGVLLTHRAVVAGVANGIIYCQVSGPSTHVMQQLFRCAMGVQLHAWLHHVGGDGRPG